MTRRKVGGRRNLRDWRLNTILEKIDVFGTALPAFNLKGRSQVHTKTGGVLTFVISVVMLIYAAIKLI